MIPALVKAGKRKAALVTLGQYALQLGHWQWVMALTQIIAREGLRHA